MSREIRDICLKLKIMILTDFLNLETPNLDGIRPEIQSGVNGHLEENCCCTCVVPMRLVDKVAGPVRCVPCPDQIRTFVPDYSLSQNTHCVVRDPSWRRVVRRNGCC